MAELAAQEEAHLTVIRAGLGSQAVPCPALDLGSAFAAIADASTGQTLSPPFLPYNGGNLSAFCPSLQAGLQCQEARYADVSSAAADFLLAAFLVEPIGASACCPLNCLCSRLVSGCAEACCAADLGAATLLHEPANLAAGAAIGFAEARSVDQTCCNAVIH